MTRHVTELDLALYVSGDLGLVHQLKTRLHVRQCDRCRRRVEAYRADRESVREIVAEMPDDVNWERLASEMTANIRVGLAAGECVAPRVRRTTSLGWRPAAVAAGVAVLLAGAWWLNMPQAQTDALVRVVRGSWHTHGSAIFEDRGTMVEATSSGIKLRENGSTLGVSQGAEQPLTISISAQGSASARYVDADTGQMTITSVYAQ